MGGLVVMQKMLKMATMAVYEHVGMAVKSKLHIARWSRGGTDNPKRK